MCKNLINFGKSQTGTDLNVLVVVLVLVGGTWKIQREHGQRRLLQPKGTAPDVCFASLYIGQLAARRQLVDIAWLGPGLESCLIMR